ncbi:sigma-70 family RNA polymerase sigma factor [Caulobacter sp. NIBR2454]|uniref:sigma-70 family RNA polymerase sigma factor n=1 Tax=Caulobacter sp. NIBR2454 TaxID=3015996 RepID=UPI0022B5F84A|nr:sigma-70 family RNA polymerase sigma factor [Caulobacter sp. NIBR2454]
MAATEAQLKAWMNGGLDGDAAAHAELLAALVPLLQVFFRRRLRDGHSEVEDLVQETLIAIHTRRESYDRDRVLSAWIFSIARYKLVDHFRRTRRHVPLEGLEEILIAEGFEEGSNARVDVNQLLGGLPTKQSRAIRQTRLDGLSITEAASQSGLSESDVKISVHRGLKAVAARLSRGSR